MHLTQFGLTVHSIGVDVDFAIKAQQVTFRSNHQRVDFQQCEIILSKHFTQAHEDFHELFDLITLQA
ncbi:Uncharacterised protein [Vibrio cholerae]|nr:Uncharacterised protein [Vibrio cholerae]